MIRPKEPTSSLSAASAAAIPLSTSPSQAPRTVVDLLGLLEPLTSNPHVKADQELRALFTDKVVELLIQEETDTLKDTDKSFCRAVQRLLDNEGKVNDVFKRALLKTSAPILSIPSAQVQIPSRPITAFGATEWSAYFGDVGTEPPLPPNIHDILNAPCPYWPDKKVSETHMLVLIPEKVNGHPLTLKTLGELVQTPKKGHASNYRTESFFHTYRDTPAPTSHWILMTRDVIPGSRAKSFAAQKALLKGGDTVPKLLDATTAIFMQNASGGKHGYVRDPWISTRCEEPYNEWQMAVGGLAPLLAPGGGLIVSDYSYDDSGHVGVAAARKF